MASELDKESSTTSYFDDPIHHAITVERLAELLRELLPTDVLVPNAVQNLLIVRNGCGIGFIDCLHVRQTIEWWGDESSR